MSTLTFPGNQRASMRMEVFHNLTVTLRLGHPLSFIRNCSRQSIRKIARSVGLPVKSAEQTLQLHSLFTDRFGTKHLAMDQDESSIIDPDILTDFLSQPAVLRLVSDISTISETGLLEIIKKT